MALGPGPLEDLQQEVGRLGARGAVLPVDDEERDARGAEQLGGRGVLGGRGPVAALGERGARLVGVQPDLGRERDEGVDVEDRAGLGEVGVQQPLLELALAAVLGGEVQQLVREGVLPLTPSARWYSRPSSAATCSTRVMFARICSTVAPYFAARAGSVSWVSPSGMLGSSWKDRQTTSTSSRWGNRSSAASSRRLPM